MNRTSIGLGLLLGLVSTGTAFAGDAYVARTAAERATARNLALWGGGRIVHEIDGETIVVRTAGGTAATAPVRLRAAEEQAAIAALSEGDRQVLIAALDGTRRVAVEAHVLSDHAALRVRMPSSTSASTSALATAAVLANPSFLVDAMIMPGWDRRPGFYDTSEFLYGKVAVNVVFVSSTGSDHKFSAADREDALADLVEGLDMWAIDLPKAKLSFKYRTFHATTSRDPIEEAASNRRHWAAEVLSQVLGKTVEPNAHYEAAYELANDARAKLGCQWAFTCFFVKGAESMGDVWDAVWDGPNGEFIFGDGQTAFAMLGGPYMVMPYSRVLGIHFWNAPILSHEFGHIFYALDEYPTYAEEGHTHTEKSGYFQVNNGNLDTAGAPSDVSCIMRGSMKYVLDYVLDHAVSIFVWGDTHAWSYPICSYTRGMMGYIDSDGDGVVNPLDVAPELSVSSSVTGAGAGRVVNVSGSVKVGARQNLNPYDHHVHPAGERRNLNLDSIASVKWRVNGGAWNWLSTSSCTSPGAPISFAVPAPEGVASVAIEIEAVTGTGQKATKSILRSFPVVARAPAIASASAVSAAAAVSVSIGQ